MKLIWRLFFPFLLLCLIVPISYSQPYDIIESGNDHLIIKFNLSNYYSLIDTTVDGVTYQKIRGEDHSFRNPGDPWIPELKVLAGIPFHCTPTIKILQKKQSVLKNKFIIPLPEEDPELVEQDFEKINPEVYSKNEFYPKSSINLGESYIVRYARILPIIVAPYQFNPVTRDVVFNSEVVVRIDFNVVDNLDFVNQTDAMTDEYLKSSVVNYSISKNFIGKKTLGNAPLEQNNYWYNPDKDYFKIYVKDKNVYRLTYEELIASGAQLGSNTSITKLEMFNDGTPVPIEVFDINNDLFFNQGDYLQFVGYPPTPSPYCKLNIYNQNNVYWFSYQSDSTGYNYKLRPAYTENFDRSYFNNLTTIHYEKDSLYERLGYAGNQNRDLWFWDKASSLNGAVSYRFVHYFPSFPGWSADSLYVRIRVAMQGMTRSSFCENDHNAYIIINNRTVGQAIWADQNNIIFDKRFHTSPDSIPIFPGNELKIEVRGDSCTVINDEIRINWVEFEYWRGNSAFGKYFNFVNHDSTNVNRYGIFNWPQDSDVRVYIPNKGKLIHLPIPATYQQFVDTMTVATEYFLAASDYYETVDSIIADIPSDFRNMSNGCDYIIITHNKFSDIANQLADFRQSNFPDESIPNPRICVVDVQEIYDEFSFGLLEPKSLQDFVKFAFENWTAPAPTYVVLLGDMSYDYRGLLESSRPNFIPSMPYYAQYYGQSASDNLIVAVSGEDPAPDLAIGRLSCETVEEADILLQKLINYPDDSGKPWKQNVLFLASGLDLQDELSFGFNDASLLLGNTYVKPEGFATSYVFRYPSKPEHEPYQGEGPKIREEINKGAALVNYYGHGGGYQWDLVFTNDDIYLLENEGRLPVILSVTCYTAHFDNQDVFGEQFNKVPGKGSIGFYGSSGLTYWTIGKAINREFFKDIFTNRNYIVGKAIMNSKNNVSSAGLYGQQLNLLTYLGDPVMKLALPQYPDFEISSDDITLNPENPLLGDSIQIKINIDNWGTVFPNDSVVVELYAELADTSYQIGQIKRPNFPEQDSVYFTWIPDRGGLYTLNAKVNETEIIMEEDHSDNSAIATFIIFNISEPNALTPVDGFVSTSNQIEFNFSDIGHYIPKALEYFIEIYSSANDTIPVYSSGKLIPERSLVKWVSPNLPEGIYFWKARIFDGNEYGNWSPAKSFSIMNEDKNGYYAHEKILKTYNTYNVNYSEQRKSLVLSTDTLPSRPSYKTILNSYPPSPQIPDSLTLTTLTTDGTYLYFANIRYYANILSDGKSNIYRVGTGNNGTVEGQFYGQFSNFRDTILTNIVCHSNGYLYVAIGDPYKIVRINIQTETIDTIVVPPGILRDNGRIASGPQYMSSDGQYIYNLAYVDSLNNAKYTVRVFDPSNNWSLVRSDVVLFGESFDQSFTGFFVHGDQIYTCDYFNNFMRRHNVVTGFFEEQWLIMQPRDFQSFYAWCNDWTNDEIYASSFRYLVPEIIPKFTKFRGFYVDASGSITTPAVGPVAWWNKLKYDFVNPSPSGEYTTTLLGQNYETKIWDTLKVNVPDSISLSFIDADSYPNLRLVFDLIDSTFQTSNPMELKSVHFDYHPLNDIYVEREDVIFYQDSLLQGYPITFDAKARNFGDIQTDSLNLSYYLNGLDSLLTNQNIVVPVDSFSNQVQYTIDTRHMIFENKVLIYGSI